MDMDTGPGQAAPAARAAPAAPAQQTSAGPATPLNAIGSRMARASGVAGLAFAILFTVALVLLRTGEPPSDPAEFDAWLNGHRDSIALGTYLVPFAGIAFIWFVAAVRRRIGEAEGLFFSSVFLLSAVLFVGTLFVSGAAAGVITLPSDRDTEQLRALAMTGWALGHAMFFGFTVKMAGMFMLVSASIGRSGRALPPWLLLLSVLLGIGLLVGNIFLEPIALVFPAWVALASAVLLQLDRQRAAAAPKRG